MVGYLFLGGIISNPASLKKYVKRKSLVVAADKGAENALILNQVPNVIVGDCDSLTPAVKEKVGNALILKHPEDKDESDGELALKYLISQKPDEIFIFGAAGGRLDHEMVNLVLLTQVPISLPARIVEPQAEVFYSDTSLTVNGKKGDLLSLIPWGPQEALVHTTGLKFALSGQPLRPGGHGLSNVMEATQATIKVDSGSVFVFHSCP